MARLTNLPTELVEQVAENLRGAESLQLRLVCRDLDSKLLHTIIGRSFTELTLMLSNLQSLRRVLNISRHPLYKQKVKRLVVLIDEYVQYKVGDRDRRAHELPASETPAHERNQRALRRNQRQIYADLLKDQQTVRTAELDVSMLTEIMTNVFSGGQSIGLTVTESDSGNIIFRDSEDIFKMFLEVYGDYPRQRSSWDHDRPTQVILRAIRQSGLRVNELLFKTWEWAVPFRYFSPDGPFAEMQSNWVGLRSLELSLQAECHQRSPVEAHDDTKSLLEFVESVALTLESLYLRVPDSANVELDSDHPGTTRLIKELAIATTFPSLRELRLSRFYVNYKEFSSFLARHAKTLETLSFESIYVRDHPILSSEEWDKKVASLIADAALPKPKWADIGNEWD